MKHLTHSKTAVLALATLLFFCAPARAQYILNGSAKQLDCHCYELTPASTFQSGSVWNSNKISLSNAFDFTFNVYLGCNDANGADGIVFMLQPLSTSIGTSGEGMGFSGVTPSIGIALDTWQNANLNDPAYDHISIQANGNPNHNADLAGPVAISNTSDNVEDCQWHTLRISWDPVTHWLRTWFDGILRAEAQKDLVATIFNGDPNVFWGFSGATGGSVNVQQFCTALNPGITSTLPSDTFCIGTPVQYLNNSQSFAPIASYFWDFGDGTVSTAQNPPPHLYAAAGSYTLRFSIIGADGCTSDTLKRRVHVAALPSGSFSIRDTCARKPFPIQLTTGNDVDYDWALDGGLVASGATPQIGASAGPHNITLTISSPYGCGTPLVQTLPVEAKENPGFRQQVTDGCIGSTWSFDVLRGNALPVASWGWDFGDGGGANSQSGTRVYRDTGYYDVRTWAVAVNGCPSDTAQSTIHINRGWADAQAPRIVVGAAPTPVNGSGNGVFSWAPASLFADPAAGNTTVLIISDTTLYLTVTTAEGCIATDSVRVELFTGSDIWVPNAFTPNGDGRNDRFKPRYRGIMQLMQFTIYNRWGQVVFNTSDPDRGWDGRQGDRPAGNETFVWMLKAVDWAGKVYQLKGTVTVIR